MKLRNKKTGEIVNAMEVDLYTDAVYLKISKDGRYDSIEYDSLAKLNEEWEDVPEEPKDCCFVSEFGKVYSLKNIPMDKERIGWLKQIGNYFSSREEAEQAMEKLKAWKRLKDKGFEFDCVSGCWIEFTLKSAISDEDYEQGQKDLHLIFGGEE